MMTRTVMIRRVLFILAPAELGIVIALVVGVNVPVTIRWLVGFLLLLTALTEVVLWTAEFRQARRQGESRPQSFVAAIRGVLGDRFLRFIMWEIALWLSLMRLVTRRYDVPATGQAFSAHRAGAPMMYLMVGLVVVEIVVLHILIPWDAVRLVVLILGLYSLLWVLGYIASLIVHPHTVTDHQVQLRRGTSVDARLPLPVVDHVATQQQIWADVSTVAVDEADPRTLVIAHNSQTNACVHLRHPIEVTIGHRRRHIGSVAVWADDPEGLTQAIESRVSHMHR